MKLSKFNVWWCGTFAVYNIVCTIVYLIAGSFAWAAYFAVFAILMGALTWRAVQNLRVRRETDQILADMERNWGGDPL